MFTHNDVLQTSPALVALPASAQAPRGTMGVYEFLSKSYAYLPVNSLYWLDYLKDGVSWAQILADHRDTDFSVISADLEVLREMKFIAVQGSAAFEQQRAYRNEWKWDITSGLFHFTVLDNDFHPEDEWSKRASGKVEAGHLPVQFAMHGDKGQILDDPAGSSIRETLQLIAKRRTNRLGVNYRISRAELSACLFAGFGIVGEVRTSSGMLPLSTTPSGGARNPFEAYVIVNSGSDIDPGVYHYSAYEHSLLKLDLPIPDNQARFFANQSWASNKSAIIVLVANFGRVMWKYPDPNAYRVILIEAGHRGQNIVLAATGLGLSACPTAALAHTELAHALGIDSLLQNPVYAFTLDQPAGYPDEFVPNRAFANLMSQNVPHPEIELPSQIDGPTFANIAI